MTSTNSELIVLDQSNGRRVFGGIIKEVKKNFVKNDTYIEECLVQDYTRLIDDVENGVSENYSSQTERAILSDLFSNYCSTIIVGQYVITGSSVSIEFQNSSLRQAIVNLAALNSRKWYVDYHKNLHYFTLGDEAAPFGLSDTPNQSTTFDYWLTNYTEDLAGNEKRGEFTCWRDGLFSGQIVELTSNKMSWSAEQFLIYEVRAKPLGYDTGKIVMEYVVSFGGKPRRITDRLTDPSAEADLTTRTVSKTILFPIEGTLSAGSNKSFEIPAPIDLTCTGVYINVKTAPTGDTIIVDVNLDGSTIFSTQANRPTIAISSTTGQSGTPNTTSFTKNQILSIDIDQVGSTVAGKDLVVSVRCTEVVQTQ